MRQQFSCADLSVQRDEPPRAAPGVDRQPQSGVDAELCQNRVDDLGWVVGHHRQVVARLVVDAVRKVDADICFGLTQPGADQLGVLDDGHRDHRRPRVHRRRHRPDDPAQLVERFGRIRDRRGVGVTEAFGQ